MKFRKFSLIFDNIFGIRLKFHWTILPAMAIFSGFKFQPVYFLSFFLLILIHEIGHALMVSAYSFENHELIVHGLGGACIWSGSATQKQISVIAWGGILAQLLVFAIFLAAPKLMPLPHYEFIDQIFRAFIGTNVLMMILNLIPADPLDGAQAWKILDPVWRDLKSIRNRQKNRKSDEIVKNQIKQIFKENEEAHKKGVERFPR